ncbi:Spy/CpxP family protein refolding chaperone [Pinibacter soli]|uniref:Periplasmic heavy metal sensor n=1 Tax=Pinibacter soli TaxID=3044211 RepID=A0ABT6R9B6_9BACT|nr:hypothetical protein [Pinibacter soli]MDI3318482.1 hypothetical protein [Pinibacter soli]
MSTLSKPVFLKWLVIVLLLINAATLAYLYVGVGDKKKPAPSKRGRDFIEKELGLNAQQKIQHDSLHKIFSDKQQAIFGRIKVLKDSLYFNSNASNDSALVDRYTQQIGAELTTLEKESFYHFKKVRGICTPEQQVKLDTIISRINNMQRGPRKPQQQQQ